MSLLFLSSTCASLFYVSLSLSLSVSLSLTCSLSLSPPLTLTGRTLHKDAVRLPIHAALQLLHRDHVGPARVQRRTVHAEEHAVFARAVGAGVARDRRRVSVVDCDLCGGHVAAAAAVLGPQARTRFCATDRPTGFRNTEDAKRKKARQKNSEKKATCVLRSGHPTPRAVRAGSAFVLVKHFPETAAAGPGKRFAVTFQLCPQLPFPICAARIVTSAKTRKPSRRIAVVAGAGAALALSAGVHVALML